MMRDRHGASTSREATLLFLIGPGGVGKSTSGPLLADLLGFRFVDLDAEFNHRVGDIQSYIDSRGYLAYCNRNTRLFQEVVVRAPTRAVHAISSGFLLYREVSEQFSGNEDLLRALGISILLLPSDSLTVSSKIVVSRLMQRRPWLSPENELRKFTHRYREYLRYGDVQVFSAAEPEEVATQMKTSYHEFLRARRSGASSGDRDGRRH